jgi:hypothetical protein
LQVKTARLNVLNKELDHRTKKLALDKSLGLVYDAEMVESGIRRLAARISSMLREYSSSLPGLAVDLLPPGASPDEVASFRSEVRRLALELNERHLKEIGNFSFGD